MLNYRMLSIMHTLPVEHCKHTKYMSVERIFTLENTTELSFWQVRVPLLAFSPNVVFAASKEISTGS